MAEAEGCLRIARLRRNRVGLNETPRSGVAPPRVLIADRTDFADSATSAFISGSAILTVTAIEYVVLVAHWPPGHILLPKGRYCKRQGWALVHFPPHDAYDARRVRALKNARVGAPGG